MRATRGKVADRPHI